MTPIIEVKNLAKRFKTNQALKGISFEVHEGEILCLLGPNGAGKSTAINIISTALSSDAGSVDFRGKHVMNIRNRYKRSLGIVPQDLAIYGDISAEQNVRFFASLYGLRGKTLQQRTHEALDFVGLSERKHHKPKTFSGGMKRRLNIACAIAHQPELLIMDEPTVGIDPQSRNHILQSIKRLKEQGTTIVYTTHYMEEVEDISTRIIVMDHGAIITTGTKEELKERFADEKLYRVEVDHDEPLNEDELFRIEGVKRVEIVDHTIEVTSLAGIENLDKVIGTLMGKGLKIRRLTTVSANLEMVFLKLTGRTLRD